MSRENLDPFCVILCTFSALSSAKALAREIVEKKLAACINLVPNLHSIYTWDDQIVEDDEILAIIKTRRELVKDLESLIKSKHEYETPEFIGLPIVMGSKDYLNWINAVT